MGRRPDAFEPEQDHGESTLGPSLEGRPAAGEPGQQPACEIGRQRERGQRRGGDDVDGQDDRGRVFQRRRHGNDQNQHAQDQHEGEAVEQALDHDRRSDQPHAVGQRPIALSGQPPGRDVDPHELPRAQRQDVVGHVPDHVGRHEPRRLGAGGEEVAPAPGAGPQAQGRDRHRRHHPDPLRGRELATQLGEIAAAKQIDEEGDADEDARDDAQAFQRSRAAITRLRRGSSWWRRRRPAAGRSSSGRRACYVRVPRGSASPPAPLRACPAPSG